MSGMEGLVSAAVSELAYHPAAVVGLAVQALAVQTVVVVLAAAPVGADRASVCCSWHQYVGRATLK